MNHLSKIFGLMNSLFAAPDNDQKFTFIRGVSDSTMIDVSDLVDEATIQLKKEVPQELVISMFQKMVRGTKLCICSAMK